MDMVKRLGLNSVFMLAALMWFDASDINLSSTVFPEAVGQEIMDTVCSKSRKTVFFN